MKLGLAFAGGIVVYMYMIKSLPIIRSFLIDILRRHKVPAKDETQVLFGLQEEVAELSRAVRAHKPNEVIAEEVADVAWNLMRLCEIRGIDLEQTVLDKVARAEAQARPARGAGSPQRTVDFYNGGGN